MLSLKYVMAKSKELTSKLELSSVVAGIRSGNADAPSTTSSVAGSDAVAALSVADGDVIATGNGEAFLLEQSKDWHAVMTRHRKLLQSGEMLGDELARARKRLQDQVESEAYVVQHFHEIKRVREQLGAIRGLVEKIAEDVEQVEQFLMQDTEEYMAAHNAAFVARQERELDLFEERILEEKEDRKKQLLAARREVLAEAFQNDLKTYQTLVAYQGPVVAQRTSQPADEESLESVDLVVSTDEAQLEAFYDTEDDEDGPMQFTEEEEKSNDGEQEPSSSEPLEIATPAAEDETVPAAQLDSALEDESKEKEEAAEEQAVEAEK